MTGAKPLCEIGIIGLGTMGRNLLLNMADHGFVVAGYDKDPDKVQSLQAESKQKTIHDSDNIKTFIALLKKPRAVLLLVPAGPIVDAVIVELLQYLEPGDLIIDAGNSYFKDTDLRMIKLKDKGIQFLGIGISGGEAGARHGPSMMPGGEKTAYARIQMLLEAVAAVVDAVPCVTYLGPGSAGHFVKMIHNGIEYGIMQLISETYDLMKRGLGLNNNQLSEVYREWNTGELNSYLLEITAEIFEKNDEKTAHKLIDMILDVAEQNGTGMWTTLTAMELQVPVPTIDAAVSMRDLSVFINERAIMGERYQQSTQVSIKDQQQFKAELKGALFASMIITYAQGFSVLGSASKKYQYDLNLEAIAQIWQGGCIIRAALLKHMKAAFHIKHDLPNLLLDTFLSQKMIDNLSSLRKTVLNAVQMGIPIPGLMASLGYVDAYRSKWLPTNLIQAQRDFFGSHRYERIDAKGKFHTEWEKTE